MQPSKELIEHYIGNRYQYVAHKQAINYYNKASFHFNGYDVDSDKPNPYFKTLIENQRPGENEQIKAYRKSIYKTVTKAPCDKVTNSLKKITKAPDFKIDYKESLQPAKIKQGETLQDYCESNLPIYRNVTNWFLQCGLTSNLTDPNGAIVVLPYSYDVKENEYVKPLPYFVLSENIHEFKEGEFILYKSDRVYEYTANGRKYTDNIFIYIDRQEVWEIRKMDFKGKFQVDLKYSFIFDKLPAFRPGAIHWKIVDNLPLYKSLVDGMFPYLDIAAREWSDLEAEVVQHMYSTLWYYASQDCTQCNGTGKILRAGKQSVCGNCDGSGKMKLSPYHSIKINPAQFGENQAPTPPAGYIQKDTEIVKVQDERIKQHIKNALGAIHMDFLVNADQSGIAKAYDRDELNNWVYGCAYHFVWNIIKPVYELICDYRYSYIITSAEERKKMLPYISVPTKYELITANIIGDQVKQARDAQMDSTIINELEWEYARKAFNNDTGVLNKMYIEKVHDPFSTIDTSELNEIILAGKVPTEDYILSLYITNFTERALFEHKDFIQLSYDKQHKILIDYANEKIKATLPSSQMLSEITAEEKVLQKLQSVSPLVANSILDSLSDEQVLSLVGLKKDKTKEVINNRTDV